MKINGILHSYYNLQLKAQRKYIDRFRFICGIYHILWEIVMIMISLLILWSLLMIIYTIMYFKFCSMYLFGQNHKIQSDT